MLDLTVVVLAYAGVRLYETIKKGKAKKDHKALAKEEQGDKVPEESHQENEQSPKSAEEQKAMMLRKQRRYQKLSAVAVGTGILRMLSPSPVFTLINLGTYIYTMFPFYRQVENAIKEPLLKEGKVDSYLLMGTGNALLLGTGRYVTASIGVGLAYVGDALITKATETAQKQLTSNLFENLFDPHHKVWLVKDGIEVEITLEQVQQGDILVIKAGETIPIDGEVVTGMASVDQHAFTGESYPVEKGVGETVFASTLMLTGQLQVRVEKSGRETTIGRIGEILTQSLQGKTEMQLRGEQWADAANLPFLALAGGGLVTVGANGAMVILSGNTVQAIRLLAPLATINYQSVASRQQILIKRGQRLEQVSSLDTFLFDKTGTLTDGELKVSGLVCVHPGYQENDILFYAALAEHQLTHPIAKAIIQYAEQAGINVKDLDDIEYRLGFGIMVRFENHTIHVGSARFMAAEKIPLSEAVINQQSEIHTAGHSLVMVAIDHEVAGLIELEATLRPEVQMVFQNLRENGIKHIAIVSGDHTTPTQKLAEQLGVDSFFAEVLPEDKADIVQKFKSEGHTVCFIGDGVNDAIAMQQADLSISLRGATTLATDVADIILTDPNLTKLCELLTLSQRLETNLKRGLGICYLGMGTVLLGTLFNRMDILAAMGIHFFLGSSAIGNAMLPLMETVNKPVLKPQLEPESLESEPLSPSPTNSSEMPRETAIVSVEPLPKIEQPLVIVGAGAAGMACALTAAAQGGRVMLVEQSGQPGGTVAQAFIHTLGGLFDDQGKFLNSGLPVELVERLSQASSLTKKRRIGKTWTLSVDPSVYAQVVSDWLNEYPNLEIHYHTIVTKVSTKAESIEEIIITGKDQSYTVQPRAVIDTTGQADIVRNVSDVTEGIALAGLVLQLRKVAPKAIKFPKGAALVKRIRKAVEEQKLPPECAHLWLDSGVYPDEVYVKFNLKPSDYNETHMAEVSKQLLTFLQAIPGFDQAVIHATGQLGIRDGGRVRGDYTLTEADLKQGRRFPDAVCQASWPIEFWDPEEGVTLDHFPPGHRYDIPLQALKVKGLQNLFVAGKCFSAEPRAQASARVVGTCWAMGEGLTKAILLEA